MSDYSALAQRVSLSVAGVRGCLMLSRDGMVLGAYPEGESEAGLRAAWVRFAGVGDPERSYVEFPDQIWAFVRRGAYGAFAVADIGVRPGVLVDMLEQALMAGEQERVSDREMLRLPDAPVAPSGKPRSILHKPDRPSPVEPEPPIVGSEVSIPVAFEDAEAEGEWTDDPGPPSPPEEVTESSEEITSATDGAPDAEGGPDTRLSPESEEPRAEGETEEQEDPEALEGKEDEPEVDRILLAKEFAGLLQVPREDDEASR